MARPRILVLGAGAAGLAAARELRRGGLAPVVVEARARAGGRVDTRRDPALGISLEGGAEFVHGRPPGVIALAREAGQRLRAVPEGMLVLRDGRLRPADRTRSEELLAAPRADESVAAVLSRARREGWAGPEDVALARSFTEGFYLADPRTASAAALARMDAALEGIDGDRSFRADGGWAALLAPVAAEAGRPPGALRLGFTVTRVRWRRGGVVLEGRGPAGGPVAPIAGDRLVVTLPLGVLRAGAVRFAPQPAEAARAWSRLEMGPVVKVLLRFRRPPWEGRPGRRFTFLQLPGAPVPVFWTLAPRRAPVLVGWAGGPRARRLSRLGRTGALRAALRGLAPAFGIGAAALEDRLEAAEVVDWSQDPLAWGGYAVFPVGADGAAEALARPVEGTLFFAGEATEPEFAGTVDGALRSGVRAARQVLASF
jgi:monoamine oxidase